MVDIRAQVELKSERGKPLLGGGGGGAALQGRAQGKAVQVDPVKSTLKAPGIKLLKLRYDKLLSNVAFKFNVCCYSKVLGGIGGAHGGGADVGSSSGNGDGGGASGRGGSGDGGGGGGGGAGGGGGGGGGVNNIRSVILDTEEAEGALWRLVCGGGPTGLESPLGVAVQVDSVKIRVESAPGFTARI